MMPPIKLLRRLVVRIYQYLVMLPWFLLELLLRFLYGFRVEGMQNVPRKGPFITLLSEFGLLCVLYSGWASIMLLKDLFFQAPGKVLAYMQEELWAFSYFRRAARLAGFLRPLIPHSAGGLALSLLDGWRVLQEGGIVFLNTEGDMPWDGRPLPIQPGAAWLGLHTAAPLLPVICSASAYDIWPRWQTRPSLHGRVVLRIGQPFKLCDTPQMRITDQDLEKANSRIRAEIDQLRYGVEGITGWVGSPLQHGAPLEQPVRLGPELRVAARQAVPLARDADYATNNFQTPVWRRGIALLLWRCPVCHTNDALAHKHPWFRPQSVACRACGTRWAIHRMPGKDFRLQVVDGPTDLIGLDMALSSWYDEMKRGFEPLPISVSNPNLLPGEEVYLEASRVSLLPHRPNALFDVWTGREAPQVQAPGRPSLADWDSIGEGRLLLTSQRLLWVSPQGELDFYWSSVRAVYLWVINTLGIRYGAAPYRFYLGQENGLKWLTYAGTVAQRVAAQNGHKVTLSSF